MNVVSTKILNLLIALSSGVAVLTLATLKAEVEHPPLFPFVISYDTAENASSMAHLLDAPAGKNGFVRVENGRFVTDAGPIRFNGTNLTGAANFPTHEDADKLAARLARFGINCVRLHYIDNDYGNFMMSKEQGLLAKDPATQRNFDPAQLDKLDYLVATLKSHGVYTNINLHVGRKWDARDGFPAEGLRPQSDKGLDNFEPRMIELQKEYARKLLTHVNPYTGLAYANDPCIAMIEINNENSLMDRYHRGNIGRLPEPYSTLLRNKWNDWLARRYGTPHRMNSAWMTGETLDKNKTTAPGKFNEPLIFSGKQMAATFSSPQALRDFYQFIVDTERSYWREMYEYLKDELEIKSPVSATQLGYSPPHVLAELDYLDDHTYWGHPDPVSSKWRVKNTSMANSQSWASIHRLAGRRVWQKPYTLSEYNHPFPLQYGAEAQPVMRAYAALQGWDGVFSYTYNHESDPEPDHISYFFSLIARTDVLAHLPASAGIFLRGDVKEAPSEIIASADWDAYFDRLVNTRNVWIGIGQLGFDGRQSLIRKTSVDVSGRAVATDRSSIEKLKDGNQPQTIISETGEISWNAEDRNAAYWTVNTTNTKLFTGFAKDQVVSLDDIKLKIGETRLGWATVSLVSRDGTGFGAHEKPASILLAATGVVENTGMVVRQAGKDQIALDDWGKGPVLVEGIPVVVVLPTRPERTRCYALDEKGERKTKVPVKTTGNNSKITIGPGYQTIWYEIIID